MFFKTGREWGRESYIDRVFKCIVGGDADATNALRVASASPPTMHLKTQLV